MSKTIMSPDEGRTRLALPAVIKQPEDMKPMATESEADFMTRCQTDPAMQAAHPDAAEREDECRMLFEDAIPVLQDAAKVPQQRARPAVYLDDRMQRRQRAGKPNSEIGLDGKRHSVRVSII